MTSEEIHPNPTQTFCITLRSKHPSSFLCPNSLLHYCVSSSSGLLPWHSRGPSSSNSTLPIPPSMMNKRLEGTPSCRTMFGVYTWRDTVFIHIIFHSSFYNAILGMYYCVCRTHRLWTSSAWLSFQSLKAIRIVTFYNSKQQTARMHVRNIPNLLPTCSKLRLLSRLYRTRGHEPTRDSHSTYGLKEDNSLELGQILWTI